MFKQLSLNAKRALRAAPIAVALGLGAVASMVSAPAQAWYHHGYGPRIGFYVGPGYGYYPPPYYYPPTVIQSAPPVYIEQSPQPAYAAPAPAPAQNSSWYYCAGSRSYYPYVKDCPGGWQQVAPRPAP